MKKCPTRGAEGSRSMARIVCWGTLLALLIAMETASAAGPISSESIQDALKGDWGQVTFDLRYRFEHVEQDGIQSTSGDPIRLRLGYLTPVWYSLQAFAEFEGNTPVFEDDYNDTTNGKTEYAVIADPSEGELNQGWLALTAIPDTVIKGGRQRINLDNQRFIGAVGWRQMEQTFDAVNLLSTSLENFSANASFVWNVRTIASKDVNMLSPLLNLAYVFEDIGTLTGYGYLLDYDDPDDSGPFEYAFSTQTYGLRFNGSRAVREESLALLYTAEYAYQSDYQDNPEDYSADYFHFIGGLSAPNSDSFLTNISGKIGYELLGSDSGVSLKTPLGTNHGFNGWADQFLTVPPEGLQDFYGMLGATIAGIKVDLIYHDFESDAGSSDYGSEFDAMLTKKFGKNYTLLAKYANYDADEFKADVEKFWIQFTVAY
ncbi:alginate export family protein [Desulfosediminicola ganghwensis]|uniref:alginate export family protein n=1 Tax=Desulfosediminicola ganghwensis TaxID=2569540 RepID=UPI0010AD240F|nr:alginate export family protein [Desulfosediminicola ganghwensis]